MVTKTVPITREVTDYEEIQVCNNCSREVDEDGIHHEDTINGKEIELDLCSECLEKMGIDVPVGDNILLADEWVTGTGVNNILSVWDYTRMMVIGSVVFSAALLISLFVFFPESGVKRLIMIATVIWSFVGYRYTRNIQSAHQAFTDN